ncbi:hypothetical protein A2U01_0018166 [Trifolium medium]|uniref:Uncharacterized protein n=1 Tax=Trifolium medium TaxID=97028 RepID=A0A392NC76_9FABA|nr:hypothetical protein [Trifolium medium]
MSGNMTCVQQEHDPPENSFGSSSGYVNLLAYIFFGTSSSSSSPPSSSPTSTISSSSAPPPHNAQHVAPSHQHQIEGQLGDQNQVEAHAENDADADCDNDVEPPPVGVPSSFPTLKTRWRMDPCFF